jgi:regulator of replication initiation timing
MSDINEELTTEHDIYISIGLKQPMKPSDCNKLIDSLLTENFNMSSWGTHTKNEWIEVLHELEGTIESQKEEIEDIKRHLGEHIAGLEFEVESLKAINELAVKGLEWIATGDEAYHTTLSESKDWIEKVEETARCAVEEIQRLSHEQT